MMKIRVLMVDDHVLFRDGMRYVLHQLADEVEVLDTGYMDDAFRLADENPDLDLVLMDLHMPGSFGVPTVSNFHKNFPAIPIVVVSGVDERESIERVMEIGAMGFISKMSPSKVMLAALRLVLDGGIYVPTQVLANYPMNNELSMAGDRRVSRSVAHGLTLRQVETLKLLAEGLDNKEISLRMGVAEGTVKAHLASVFHALRVKSRTEAVCAGRRLGIVNFLEMMADGAIQK
jgi:DNA-binding NarL/FixJ family response regulator